MHDVEIIVTCVCGCQAAARMMAAAVDHAGLAAAFVRSIKSDGWRKDGKDRWLCPKCSGKPRDVTN